MVLTSGKTMVLSSSSSVRADDDQFLENAGTPKKLSQQFSHNESRRPSNVSRRPSCAPSEKTEQDARSVAEHYYNELSPEQGYTQAATDGLRKLSLAVIAHNTNDDPNCAPSNALDCLKDTPSQPLPPENSSDSRELLSSRKRIFILALICTTNLCLALNYSLIAPFFPTEMIRKGGTASLGGIVMGSYDLVRTILAPIIGHYIYQLGPRFMLVTGPFVAAWCSVLFGLLGMGPGGTVFVVLSMAIRMTSAVGTVCFGVTSVSVRPVLFAGYLSFAFAMLQVCFTTGVIVGPALGGVLYSVGGYGLPFYVTGAFALSLTIVQMIYIPDLSKVEKIAEQQRHEKAIKSLPAPEIVVNGADVAENVGSKINLPPTKTFRQPSFLGICREPSIVLALLLSTSYGLSLTFYSTNLALHVGPLLGKNADSQTGYIILIAGITEVLVAPGAGWLLDHGVRPRWTIVAGYLFDIVGLALIGPSPILFFLKTKLWLIIVGSAVFGCGIGCGVTSPYKLASQMTIEAGFPANSQTFGLLAGCYASAYTSGAFLGPLIGGILHDSVGFPWAATLVCGLLMLMSTATIVDGVIRRFKQTVADIS